MPLIESITSEVALLSIPETMLTPRLLAEPKWYVITAFKSLCMQHYALTPCSLVCCYFRP